MDIYYAIHEIILIIIIICILEDLNRWIGEGARATITGAFGVPRENDNGSSVVELCAERGLCLGNIL